MTRKAAPIKARVLRLENGQDTLKKSQAELREQVRKMDSAILDIRTRLSVMPTSQNLSELRTHIDNSINNVLRDALSAVPQRAVVIMTIIIVLMTSVPVILHFWP